MNSNSTKSNESGMVMIFVVTAIFTVIVLLGLFLDVGTMMIAKRDREKTARIVSSEAISVFNRDDDPQPRDRGTNAQAASQELANTNLNLQFAKSFFGPNPGGQDIGLASHGNTGELQPGLWYFNQTGVFDEKGICKYPGHTCPCEGNTWNGPCFRPINGWNDPLSISINSFSTDLYTSNTSKLKTTFMGIVGQKEVALSSQSTIALRPLNVVALVDLSRFVDEETHIPFEVAGLGVPPVSNHNPARFAYEIDTPGSCNPSERMQEVTLPINEENPIPDENYLTCRRDPILGLPGTWNRRKSTCTLLGGDQIAASWYNSIFNWTNNNPSKMFLAQREATHPSTYHAKFDYRCLSINFMREDGSNNVGVPYLVDLRRNSTYRGAEPLETFVQGVRESIKKIKDRNLRGDSISVIGFDWDSEIKRRRILGLNPIDDATEFGKLETLFQVPYDSADQNAHFQKLKDFYEKTSFIPRNGNRFLSIPYALNQAYKILKARPNFAVADNMVVLLTTGLTNCIRNGDVDQTCGQDKVHFDNSIEEVRKFSTDFLAKQGILLHILLRSPRVQPVTKIVKNGASCSIEENVKGFNQSSKYVFTSTMDTAPMDQQVGVFDPATGQFTMNNPFQNPNNLAVASMATGGVWAPIRPICPGVDKADCFAQFNTAKNRYCANSSDTTAGVIDASGNILCDPACNKAEDQVTNAIEKMFDLTPLLPVGEGVTVH